MAGSSTRSTQLQQWSLSPVFPRGVLNTLRPRQYCRHFTDDIFKCIFMNENVWILIKISLKYVPKVRINNIPALVQIMAWRRLGDKPLSEQMMVCFTDIYASPGLNELIIGDIETEMYLEKLLPLDDYLGEELYRTKCNLCVIGSHYCRSLCVVTCVCGPSSPVAVLSRLGRITGASRPQANQMHNLLDTIAMMSTIFTPKLSKFQPLYIKTIRFVPWISST